MKKNILQIYALLVCFVTIIIVIISLWTILSSTVDLLAPQYKNYSQLSTYHSHESYKLSSHHGKKLEGKTHKEIEEMRKQDKELAIEQIKGRAVEHIINYILGLIIAILFFRVHWNIAKKNS